MVFHAFSNLVLITGTLYMVYLGLQKRVRVEDKFWDHKVLIYREIVGNYDTVDTALDSVIKDFSSSRIDDFTNVAILYDISNHDSHHGKSRAAVGVLLDYSQKKQADNWITQNKEYSVAELSNISSVSSGRLTHSGFLSTLWIKNIVYPRMWDYGERNLIYSQANAIGIIKIFHGRKEDKESQIEILVPHGKNAKALVLTSLNPPSSISDIEL